MKRFEPGYVYVMAVPFVAAVSSIQGVPSIGGFRYTGWLWLITLVAGSLLVLSRKAPIRFPVMLWLVWFIYVWVSLIWVDSRALRNYQDAVQITMPLVVGAAASVFIRNRRQLRTLRRAFTRALFILLAVFVVFRYVRPGGMEIQARALALTTCLLGCVFVAGLSASPALSIIGWGLCLALTVITGSRMATFALLALWVAYPWRGRLAPRILASAGACIVAVALFYSPVFQHRFFEERESMRGSLGDVAKGDIFTAGRADAWPRIWRQAQRHIIVGAGIGQVGKFVPTVWPGVDQPHNEYLRIAYDLGLVGLACFVGVVVAQMLRLQREMRYATGELRYAGVASRERLARAAGIAPVGPGRLDHLRSHAAGRMSAGNQSEPESDSPRQVVPSRTPLQGN